MRSSSIFCYCTDEPLTLNDLYKLAEDEHITVDRFPCKNEGIVIDLDGEYYIGIDPSLNNRETREVLAHELGHCLTRGFYTLLTPYRDIDWIEASARRWSYGALMPVDWVNAQIDAGITSDWELAELADVSIEFCTEALQYYYDSGSII